MEAGHMTSQYVLESLKKLGFETKHDSPTKKDILTVRRDISSPVHSLDDLERRWYQVAMECDYPAIKGLLHHDPNLATKQEIVMGYTAMHWAAKKGSREVVKALGSTGTDVNTRTRGGYTALHLAVIQGHEEIISMLVDDYEADINIRDNSGYKPRHYLRPDASPWIQRKLGKKFAPPSRTSLLTRGYGKVGKGLDTIGSALVQMQALSSSLGSGLDLIGIDEQIPTTPNNNMSRKTRSSSSFVKLLKGKSKKEKDMKLEVPDAEPEIVRYRTGRARSAPNISHITNWTPRVLLVPP